MKKKFVSTWKGSKQPRKQRKYSANAPLHIKRKSLAAHLAKPLRDEHKKRSIILVSGDSVKILRGQHKGKEGKVDRVSTKTGRIYITGVSQTRKDGTKALIPFQPSNLQVSALNMKDQKRKEHLARK